MVSSGRWSKVALEHSQTKVASGGIIDGMMRSMKIYI